ncbi:MAG: hypothetical protein Q9168_005579 [Polycauliona sp. 1 TL-2023]
MDPVSAFSLAAGVIQVVDISFKAVSKCREIYKDGSLAVHRDSQDITQKLLETTQLLEKSHSNGPPLTVKHSNDLTQLSKKCSETATELLTELSKLQRDANGGFRQSLGKSIRSLRKKQFLAETHSKLDRYREILNTRILSKLDYHALQQVESYSQLDKKVQDLAVALSKGQNTYEQLLAIHTIDIKGHIDSRFDDKAHEEARLRDEQAKLKSRQQFKDSHLNTTFKGPMCPMSGTAIFDLEYTAYPEHRDSAKYINPFQNILGFAAYFGQQAYVAQYAACNSISNGDVEYILSCTILAWESIPSLEPGFLLKCKGLLQILLEYIPLSTEPYIMGASKVHLERGRPASKWAAFATFSCCRIDSDMRKSQDRQLGQEWIQQWKDVIALFLTHYPNTDPNFMMTSISYWSVGQLVIAETILAVIERIKVTALNRADRLQLEQVEDILKARGGTVRRKVLSVAAGEEKVWLTDDLQSDRVLSLLSLKQLSLHLTPDPYSGLATETPAVPTESDIAEAEKFVAGWEAYGKSGAPRY